jgi:hypothetical protein
MATAPEVLHAALCLGPAERAEIAHRLLLSLDPVVDDDAEQGWADEIRRRLRALREGRVALRDWDDVLPEIQQSIEKGGHEAAG